jgi:hypothetical protein
MIRRATVLATVALASIATLAGGQVAPGGPQYGIVRDLELGSMEATSADRFGLIRGFAADSSGAFALYDHHLGELRLYSPTGKLQWATALDGALSVQGIAMTPREVGVLATTRDSRLLRFDRATGRPAGTVAVRGAADEDAFLLSGSSAGWVILLSRTTEMAGRTRGPLLEHDYRVVVLAAGGAGPVEIATYTDSTPRRHFTVGLHRGVANQPFSVPPSFAALGGEIVVSPGGSPALEHRSWPNGPARSVRLAIAAHAITPTDVGRFLAARSRSTDVDPEVEAMRSLPVPSARPVVRRLFLPAPDEIAFIRADLDSDPAQRDPTVLQYARSSGALAGYVTVPSGEQVLAVVGGWVYAVRTDQTRTVGVFEGNRPRYLQQVIRYRVQRGEPRG